MLHTSVTIPMGVIALNRQHIFTSMVSMFGVSPLTWQLASDRVNKFVLEFYTGTEEKLRHCATSRKVMG
jgi:hypothetical protein